MDVERGSRVLHVGSLLLAFPLSAEAQRLAVITARNAGALISADVNLRPTLWHDIEAMYENGREVIASSDIVNLSAEELLGLTSITDTENAVRLLWHKGLKVIAVTHGSRGAELFNPYWQVSVPGFPVKVAGTVGCGDAFTAALLTGLIQIDFSALDEKELYQISLTACAAGAVVARVAGAMENMPHPNDIAAHMAAGLRT